jgi:hypothetical protein
MPYTIKRAASLVDAALFWIDSMNIISAKSNKVTNNVSANV